MCGPRNRAREGKFGFLRYANKKRQVALRATLHGIFILEGLLLTQTVKLAGGHEILQDDRFFKLTQDSVLLSDFAYISSDERGLDLGAGIGCLGIMVMGRDKGSVDGIEIEAEAARLATDNYARCSLSGRGRIVTGDFRALPGDMVQRYDMCISNPPYYSPRHGQIALQPSLATARTALNGDISELCRAAARALKTGGRLYLCYKPSALHELFIALRDNLLAPKRLRLVHLNTKKRAGLALVEARRDRACELNVMPPLFINDEKGGESEEYRRIYKDFY